MRVSCVLSIAAAGEGGVRLLVGLLLAVGVWGVFYATPPWTIALLIVGVCGYASHEYLRLLALAETHAATPAKATPEAEAAELPFPPQGFSLRGFSLRGSPLAPGWMAGWLAGSVALPCMAVWGGVSGLNAGLGVFWLVLALPSALRTASATAMARRSLGLLLIPWSLSHAVLLLALPGGRELLLLLLLLTVACDTAAFVVGKLIGRRRLAPRLSPGKTLAGAWGGALAGLTVGGLGGVFGLVPWAMDGLLAFAGGGLLGITCAVLAIVGDLVESALKREARVKESGNLFPAHGGLLDRIDSFLLTPPFLYYLHAGLLAG